MRLPLKTKCQKIIAAIIIFLIIFDIFVSGFMKFGYYVVKCGGMPVAISPPPFGVGASKYRLPGHYTPGWSSTKYLCTEQEAKERGIVKFLYD